MLAVFKRKGSQRVGRLRRLEATGVAHPYSLSQTEIGLAGKCSHTCNSSQIAFSIGQSLPGYALMSQG